MAKYYQKIIRKNNTSNKLEAAVLAFLEKNDRTVVDEECLYRFITELYDEISKICAKHPRCKESCVDFDFKKVDNGRDMMLYMGDFCDLRFYLIEEKEVYTWELTINL